MPQWLTGVTSSHMSMHSLWNTCMHVRASFFSFQFVADLEADKAVALMPEPSRCVAITNMLP